MSRATAIGFFPEDDGGVLAVAAPDQLVRVHARAWIWATGGDVVNLPFPRHDPPGVVAARAGCRLLVDHSIFRGHKICSVQVPRGAAGGRAPAPGLAPAVAA